MSTRFSRALAAATMTVLGVAVLGVTAASPAHAAVTSISASSTAIVTPGGTATASVGGMFDGLVYVDPSLPYDHTSNKWLAGSVTFLGPGGRVYRNYAFTSNGKCLTHLPLIDSEAFMAVQPCVVSDLSQWWAVDHLLWSITPCPSPPSPLCVPTYHYVDILIPWDQPQHAATSQDGLLLLKPRGGTNGTASQRLRIEPLPKFPR